MLFKPEMIILEYGHAEGTINPYNYDPYSAFPQFPRAPISVSDILNPKIPNPIRSTLHMSVIAGVIKKYAKFDFNIVSMQHMNCKKYLAENHHKVFCISASVGDFFNDGYLEQYKDSIYMGISAGNEGTQGEGSGSAKPHWTSVGAVDTNLIPTDYSSWGKGLVDFVGVSNEVIDYDYFGKQSRHVRGTSYANPQHVTQIMNLMCDMYEKSGVKPSIKQVLKLRDKHTIDIVGNYDGVTIGHDLRTGLGYYGYEKGQANMKKLTMQLSGTVITVEENKNGVVTEKLVESPIPIQAINGTTMLPLRTIGEILDCKVGYDAPTKTVTVIDFD